MEIVEGGVTLTLALKLTAFPPLSFDFSRSRRRAGDGKRRRLADDGAGRPELSGHWTGHQRGPGAVRPEALQPRRRSAPRPALSGVPAPTAAALVPGQHAGVPAEVSQEGTRSTRHASARTAGA